MTRNGVRLLLVTISSGNGLSPVQHLAITCTIVDLLATGTSDINLVDFFFLSKYQNFIQEYMISKWQPRYLVLDTDPKKIVESHVMVY